MLFRSAWAGDSRLYRLRDGRIEPLTQDHSLVAEWVRLGVFRELWKAGLMEYDQIKGIQWDWQSIDGAMTKAPLGGGENRAKPYGSGEIRQQALPAYGWRRRSPGSDGGRRKYA